MIAVRLPIAVENTRDVLGPATVVGLALIISALWLIASHRKTWRQQSADSTIDESERRHLRLSFRRRMQASGIILLIGILIPLGDWGIEWNKNDPTMWTIYWLMVLALTCWLLLLAIADLAAIRSRSRAALSQIYQKQRALQAEVDRLQAEADSSHNES